MPKCQELFDWGTYVIWPYFSVAIAYETYLFPRYTTPTFLTTQPTCYFSPVGQPYRSWSAIASAWRLPPFCGGTGEQQNQPSRPFSCCALIMRSPRTSSLYSPIPRSLSPQVYHDPFSVQLLLGVLFCFLFRVEQHGLATAVILHDNAYVTVAQGICPVEKAKRNLLLVFILQGIRS